MEPLTIASQYQNPWSSELETEFWLRANQAIQYYAGQEYGNTWAENEKRSYALAMFDFVAGNREKAICASQQRFAIAFLQSEDAQVSDHQHTKGIDYYYSFTLKGQIRKYFYLGKYLAPAYKQRMFNAAKKWTEKDPLSLPHSIYKEGDGSGNDWDITKRGLWVDSRNTDNLRAMIRDYFKFIANSKPSKPKCWKLAMEDLLWKSGKLKLIVVMRVLNK